jgi:hypothetical protein
MTTKLTDLVRNEGKITTIAKLDDRGLITYREVKNFQTKRSVGTKYFAEIGKTKEGWEIGKLAYLSRTKQIRGEKPWQD